MSESDESTYPTCIGCGREPVFPPDWFDGDPYCIVCSDFDTEEEDDA